MRVSVRVRCHAVSTCVFLHLRSYADLADDHPSLLAPSPMFADRFSITDIYDVKIQFHHLLYFLFHYKYFDIVFIVPC